MFDYIVTLLEDKFDKNMWSHSVENGRVKTSLKKLLHLRNIETSPTNFELKYFISGSIILELTSSLTILPRK